MNNPVGHQAFCLFYWFTKEWATKVFLGKDFLDLNFFTIGAGALINHGSVTNFVLGIPEANNACVMNNPTYHQAFCHFYWFTKEWTLDTSFRGPCCESE